MKMIPALLMAVLLVLPAQAHTRASSGVDAHPVMQRGDEDPPLSVKAARITRPVVIDGVLDEPAWAEAPPISAFRQRDPVQGAEPTERTEVYILYDDEALYVGAMLYDSSPDSIVARLGRRDAELKADRFGFFIDPYDDNRSGYYFGVNAAGTLYDGVLMNDDWEDDSWDGIWQARVRIHEEGWTAEMRIPYSQLRFYARDRYTWGINLLREIARKNERDFLVYTPRNESGFVSRFPDLVGVEQIRPRRQVEVLPYVTAQARFNDHEAGDPFNDGSRYTPDMGADLKVGLTSNLTLNVTVNPDFGQVEVDPAVVNLSDVETYFQEKRPFFIEGASIFEFGYGGATSNWGFNWGNPAFFYSRRIGRAPQGSLPDDADFTHHPDGTRILGATKLTGKIGGGWNVGMVHALTARTWADVAQAGALSEVEVEPRAYYGIFRGQREFGQGRQGLGFISTVALRDFAEDRIRDEVNGKAYTLGLDGWTFLDRDKTWVVTGWAGMSQVHGTAERITALQRSALHYFQRPDARHVSVDSTATSLTGFSGRIALNKQRGHFYTNSAIGFVTPSFDVNDVGFQARADVINGHLGFGYRWTEPRSFYRNINLNAALFRSMDFDGNTTWAGVWARTYMQFKNYYEVEAGFALNPRTTNNRLTRGGPLSINPPGAEMFFWMSSDSRKRWVVSSNGFTYQSRGGTTYSLNAGIEWKPAANLSLSANPGVQWSNEPAQWVDGFDDAHATHTFGRRYVFGEMDQVTLASSLRLNWTFTPQLSFQLYAQPLVSVGNYHRFKELARPHSFDFNVFGENGSAIRLVDEDTYEVDPDGAGPASTLTFDNPDFSFKSLRGTAVFRWEYRPGSTLYLVWTQLRSDSETLGTFRFGDAMGRLWDAHPDNIFMVKLNYWLSR